MRVLFVLENYLPHIGGVEILFENLARGLAQKGHSVVIVTRRLPGTKARERLNGVEIVRVPCPDNRYLFTLAGIRESIRQAKRADVIHTTTYNAVLPAWVAGLVQGKPRVLTVHEVWLDHWREYTGFSPLKALAHEVLERLIYLLPFERYLTDSDSTKRQLVRAVPRISAKVRRIHAGFDPAMWRKRHPLAPKIRERLELQGKFVIFASGRPGATKGFEYLVDAAAEIKKRIPEAVLVLMLSRDRQYAHKIEEFKEKAHEDVLFMDPVPFEELPAWRQAADCVVVPSVTEGFGYALLESVATGTPVVASDTMSIPEVVYGKHVLVKPKSAKAIADGVVKAHRGRYETTPQKKFPWKRTVALHEKLYEEIA